MNARTWRLDPLEFTVLWEQFGRDRLPYPFQYRPAQAVASDFARAKISAAASVRDRLDEALYDALATLADTTLWVAAYGLTDIGRPNERVVRLHAGVSSSWATIAVQQPGATEEAGGEITLTATSPDLVGHAIVAALPSCPAGRESSFTVQAAEQDGRESRSLLRDSQSSSDRERLARLADRPRTSAGELVVVPGFAVDSRPTRDMRVFQWIDVAGDGRYVAARTIDVRVEPASRDVVAEQIQRSINRLRMERV